MGALEVIACPKVAPNRPEYLFTTSIQAGKANFMKAYEEEAKRVSARIRREELLEKVAVEALDFVGPDKVYIWQLELRNALEALKADGWEPK